MNSIVIQIKDNKAIKILQSLRDINLIDFFEDKENQIKNELLKLKVKNNSENESIFDLAGIWKDRDTNIDELRKKAWPKRK
jgi:Mg/Co/Ni transporter MgtE